MSNVTIGGRGGNPIPSTTLVATDQETIFGDGSGQNPLTTSGANNGQFIPITVTLQDIVAGNPVAFNGADAIHVLAGGNNAPANAPVGIAVPDPSGGAGALRVQTGGIATLPIADWDAVIAGGSSTGLNPGCWYYVDSILGQISIGVPNPVNASGSTSSSPIGARIGYALSTTELLVMPGGSPNTVVLPTDTSVILGMPVLATGAGQFTPAECNAASSVARANAVAGYINTDGSVVGFTDGMTLELTQAQWNARTGGSGGLTEGDTYWVSSTAAGGLANTPPVATNTFQVMVGQALSATKLLIQLGQPVGPHA